ncbi:MAG TPA: copper oxidase [Thermoanaerobaculia bacterium]|nr:copper oxidase [Thermoanaerobaculia bacterium]
MIHRAVTRSVHRLPGAVVVALLSSLALAAQPAAAASCERTLFAEVVALDQPYFWNRLGAAQPQGQVFALKRDVVARSGSTPGAGNARLRDGKRPRPLVLRMNVGDCLQIRFYNWLDSNARHHQPVTREASIHVVGMQLVDDIDSDGSWVGENGSSLAASGGYRVYTVYAEREGSYLLHSAGALTGGPEGDNGTLSTGLFGAVNVQPRGSVWFRSQVTEAQLGRAIVDWKSASATGLATPFVHDYPVVDYWALYPATLSAAGYPKPNQPVLAMLSGNEIIYSDLTAIVVPNPAIFSYPTVPVYPDRDDPFREFTIIFHDEIGAVQAFRHFDDPEEGGRAPAMGSDGKPLWYTLHSVRDAFAINYGTGGIGAEILANRLGVGPMRDCVNCQYEEFFLSAWAVGDPAMVVDEPANAPCNLSDEELKELGLDPDTCEPGPGAKATRALYPDDPSNVYHSYLNDHVKFRNLLAGSDDHHIFHLHAHQWLHTPDSSSSTYLDSQAVGQGTSFTYEIAHGGSGNRNKTPGDSIFHCHFYPHFAQGMWGMWRVHDVLELGTELDKEGRPATGSRALPDGEIARGTPIPGLVPLPGLPMAPPPGAHVTISGGQVVVTSVGIPAKGNPGYPFFIPGVAGQRAPGPPLDYFDDNGVVHDGGLPRHIVTAGEIDEVHTRLDFRKDVKAADAFALAEAGEPWEQVAMAFHADSGLDNLQDGYIAAFTPEGVLRTGSAGFELNGSDPMPGAPYAEPCSRPTTAYPGVVRHRTYKAANIQMDITFNKKGWHFPQQRFLSLWEDVEDYYNHARAPEPLFIRANTGDCVTYLHSNLVPRRYELDDFQVRTPTDILGQHIHLVKFDVTSSDGSANGYNYEDGTLSPQEVTHMIDAINQYGGLRQAQNSSTRTPLTAVDHPFFMNKTLPPGVQTLGAQTTVQRWYVDNVIVEHAGTKKDATLRTVFTHDHFGPSTHQQVGLYAGLIAEKAGSTWWHGETGEEFGTRHDGGPTGWHAVIEGPDTFREFVLEFGDFQHAYVENEGECPLTVAGTLEDLVGCSAPRAAINPPGREEQWDDLALKPWIYEKPALVGYCPDGMEPPCPEAVAADDPGTMVVNYRNEPIALRVKNPGSETQAAGDAGDLSHAFASIPRADGRLNTMPFPCRGEVAAKSEKVDYDPCTPLLRAYEGDRVKMKILVGAHEEEHNFSIHGARWLFEPADPDSGLKASQMMGISEFYDFEIDPILSTTADTLFTTSAQRSVDLLYKAGSSADDLWNGIWGLIRVYRGTRTDLQPTTTNSDGRAVDDLAEQTATQDARTAVPGYKGQCPILAPDQNYHVVAVAARTALPGGRLVYNDRPGLSRSPLMDPTAILFVHKDDLVPGSVYQDGEGVWRCAEAPQLGNRPTEPLILRAAAGECIHVTLTNCLDPQPFDLRGYGLLPNIVDYWNQNQVDPSTKVGLHAQAVAYDPVVDDGHNVGRNPEQTVDPGLTGRYRWYAGTTTADQNNNLTSTPVEFGSLPLYSSDPIKHSNKGAVGALIIEPLAATWTEHPTSRARAVVHPPNAPSFREFVLVFQDDINLRRGDHESLYGSPIRPLEVSEDPAETGQAALNYRTEPVWFRHQQVPQDLVNIPLAKTFSNDLMQPFPGDPDPKTPVFHARVGDPVRFRIVHPGGDSQQHTFGLHGHVWQERPILDGSNSTVIGHNAQSEWKGAEYGHGPTNAFDVLLQNGAGGAFGIAGDYMYRDYVSWYLAGGLWGILRVHGSDASLDAAEPGWPAGSGNTTGGGSLQP